MQRGEERLVLGSGACDGRVALWDVSVCLYTPPYTRTHTHTTTTTTHTHRRYACIRLPLSLSLARALSLYIMYIRTRRACWSGSWMPTRRSTPMMSALHVRALLPLWLAGASLCVCVSECVCVCMSLLSSSPLSSRQVWGSLHMPLRS